MIMSKKGKNVIRMIEKYAEEKKGDYKAIKESMQVYEDYLKQKGVDVNKEKIISAEGYNVYHYM